MVLVWQTRWQLIVSRLTGDDKLPSQSYQYEPYWYVVWQTRRSRLTEGLVRRETVTTVSFSSTRVHEYSSTRVVEYSSTVEFSTKSALLHTYNSADVVAVLTTLASIAVIARQILLKPQQKPRSQCPKKEKFDKFDSVDCRFLANCLTAFQRISKFFFKKLSKQVLLKTVKWCILAVYNFRSKLAFYIEFQD